ncbi:zf-CCHC domain-containing protein [Cephalotus follicularis]|uniref:Zf-CCHC domain-containing protein n=1 Tax=Cephalotus follicularis TaxID=3775 RepID=A0A1Q3CHM7_CEPFO|nr:zf-CCHC domain-containing protein [Cephalotus follicularis]
MFLKSQKGKKAFKKYPHKEESTNKEELTCFECKKLGHFKSECLSLKKKEQSKKKKKAMIATWSDSDPSSSDEESDEEVANIAFMAIEEEEEDKVNFSFDELQEAYENLFHEYKNVCLKNKSLKKDAISMSKEIENLKNENSNFINEIEILNVSLKLSNNSKEENENLKLEIDALKKTFSKFSNSSNKLDNLLELQRCVFDKVGLGYEEMNKVKHFKNFFVKKIEPKMICNYCGRLRLVYSSCFLKNNLGLVHTRKIWVPKGTSVTNLQGPKSTWIPKA